MSAPATTGPTRERVTRKRWGEHPTPDDARVRHIYRLPDGRWANAKNGRPPVGSPALCGYRMPSNPLPWAELSDPSVCVVCLDLAP